MTSATTIEQTSSYQQCIATPDSCTNLHLHSNSLTGTLPTELGELTRMSAMYLHSNSLTGTLPTELGELTRMSAMEVHNNPRLCGDIPPNITVDNTSSTSLGQSCPGASAVFTLTLGDCTVSSDSTCIDSTNYPTGNYNNNELCTWSITGSGVLSTRHMDTESSYDPLEILLVSDSSTVHSYDGMSGPNGVYVDDTNYMRFTSDGSVTMAGFQICVGTGPTPQALSPIPPSDAVLLLCACLTPLPAAPTSTLLEESAWPSLPWHACHIQEY
ncbi:hypothetical protein CYMTET_12285 [Cymbomonas tetramitiformis]|uniref:CUB domain-containing protein n=1 Tax=Cymbomonas tetramitiformis TaxID=36881 RepID=A0AAE0GKY4_9CHLO|nr:hypothetical protein CYMTET_12285 [Cymbomonas tetramitiformis]